MAIIRKTVPDNQLNLLLNALAWEYGTPQTPRLPGEGLKAYVDRLVDIEWKSIVRKYQQHLKNKTVADIAKAEADKISIIDLTIS